MRRFLLPLCLLLPPLMSAAASDRLPPLLPQPAALQRSDGHFYLQRNFRAAVEAPTNSRAAAATTRFLARLRHRTGLFLEQGIVQAGTPVENASLRITVQQRGELRLGEDESYHLKVTPDGIRLEATTDLGALRGLETLLQLLDADDRGYRLAAVEIQDAPRFPWRGLMLDSARHFLPVDVIKRNLDGMAAVKLNVLHWHLTDDQGFRVESRVFPRLHTLGSDGDYYTQEQVAEIIAYADARGIRVYPEFDVPGHATSWLVGHPELASVPRSYAIERKWGIFDPALDPSNPDVYPFLEALFTEMAALFPDEYFHIGGDEVNGKDWAASPQIQRFMAEHGLKDAHALQRHFNERLLPILTSLNKKMIGWDEIFEPGMPTNIVIHSWRGREAMEKAARLGYRSILSNGYYIDLMQPAELHYLNDPLPADSPLSADEAARVLGGEATMWSEHVTVETVDSRIWPRTAAIAERLWSPQDVRDVASLYDRLAVISVQLEEHGLTHLKNRAMMMRRFAGTGDITPLATLADVVEPLKIYQRNADDSYTQFSPYTLLPDIAIADAPAARAFRAAAARYQEMNDAAAKAEVISWLQLWRDNHTAFAELAHRAPALREALPLSEALQELSNVGLEALQQSNTNTPVDAAELDRARVVLERARQPVAKVELQIVDAVASLLPKPMAP
jgi:hexosaminidase